MIQHRQRALETPSSSLRHTYDTIVREVQFRAGPLVGMSPVALRARTEPLRTQLRNSSVNSANIADAFALIRESARRSLGVAHYDTQLIAAWIMLHNRIAEMAIGEGKTLAVSLAAATAALSGVPVHVVTASDYLAERDANYLRPLYAALGLTLGTVTHTADADQRRAAYACDITYCTAKELVFDYLRDQVGPQHRQAGTRPDAARLPLEHGAAQASLLRGLWMVVVDDAEASRRARVVCTKVPRATAHHAATLPLSTQAEPSFGHSGH